MRSKYIAIVHVQKKLFLCMHGGGGFKSCGAKLSEETINLIF